MKTWTHVLGLTATLIMAGCAAPSAEDAANEEGVAAVPAATQAEELKTTTPEAAPPTTEQERPSGAKESPSYLQCPVHCPPDYFCGKVYGVWRCLPT